MKQSGIKVANGHTHNIVVGPFNIRYSSQSDPFLDAICTSLVIRVVIGDIIYYLLIAQLSERDTGGDGEEAFSLIVSEAYGCYHLMPAS